MKLSDADCERISKLCGEHNITVSQLLENFIGDLVGGTYSNGSDERDFARQWFERCWFGMFPGKTLLNFLMTNWQYNVADLLSLLDDIKDGCADLEKYEKDRSVFDEEEIEFLREDVMEWEEELAELKAEFLKENKDADWEKEIENVNQWWKAKKRLLGEDK